MKFIAAPDPDSVLAPAAAPTTIPEAIELFELLFSFVGERLNSDNKAEQSFAYWFRVLKHYFIFVFYPKAVADGMAHFSRLPSSFFLTLSLSLSLPLPLSLFLSLLFLRPSPCALLLFIASKSISSMGFTGRCPPELQASLIRHLDTWVRHKNFPEQFWSNNEDHVLVLEEICRQSMMLSVDFVDTMKLSENIFFDIYFVSILDLATPLVCPPFVPPVSSDLVCFHALCHSGGTS